MAPNLNMKKTFPFIRPHIPDSLTSGSLRSEDSPTPAPKRRKTAVSSSLPRVAGDTPSLSGLASTIQTLSRSVEELLSRGSPPKVVKPVVKEEESEGEEEEGEEDEEEEETSTGSETSSEREEIDFEEFDTEGMTEEEVKAWSSAAPKDQKLVMEIDEPPVHPSRKVHFSDQSSDKGKVDAKIKHQWMENFIRNHTFFKLRQTSASSPTPAQEKAFEKEVYDHAKRKLGFSVRNAKKQIVKARQMCGYDDGDGEIKDDKSSISPDATIDKPKSNNLDSNPSTNSKSQGAQAIQAAKEKTDSTTKSNPNARAVPEVIEKVESHQKLSNKKRKRDRPHAEDIEPVSEIVDNLESTKKHKRKKSKQVDSQSADPPLQSKPTEPKSDGINGDPSLLPEMPEHVSRYLDVQAQKKKRRKSQDHDGAGDVSSRTSEVPDHRESKNLPSKSDAMQSEKASPKIAKVDAKNPTKAASVNLETTEADDRLTKEEKKARKKERHRNERLARKSSANDQSAKPPAASTSFDDAAKTHQESSPVVQSKTPKTLQGNKKEHKQKALTTAEPRRENSGSISEESGQKSKPEPKHSHITGPSNNNSKKRPLDVIEDRAVPQSKKHKKKKHKTEHTPTVQISGFQSPMIHDAETADEEDYQSVLQETTTTESTTTSAAATRTFSKLSHADIDILYPFSDSPLSTPPSSPILPPSSLQLHLPFLPPLISSPPTTPTKSPSPSKRKPLPPRTSPYFPTPPRTPRPKVKRPAVSCIPFPPLSAPRFGLVQESLARTPFALLIAVIFLNKTRGKVALPLFYQLMQKWPTPEKLTAAEIGDVVQVFSTLGLQNQRAKKVVALAKAWVEDVPRRGRRWRRLHYPMKGDGADVGREEVLGDEDDDNNSGDAENREEEKEDKAKGSKRVAWEVARLPGVGSYAIDSWRIFCRDELRGLPCGLPSLDELTDGSETDNSQQSQRPENTLEMPQEQVNKERREELSKEWTRVLPLDKELRAYLRWRWLRVGYTWDPVTGVRERASADMIREVERGGVVVEVGGRGVVEGVGAGSG